MSDRKAVNRPIKSAEPLIDVVNLNVTLGHGERARTIVDDVSFAIQSGEILGIVGESGSGKSITALSLMRLLPKALHASGTARLKGVDLFGLADAEMRDVRGARMAIIFQEPVSALNPTFTIGTQIETALRSHRDVTRREARARAVELLALVGFPDPQQRIDFFPHQISGGMRQRVMIAMALAGGADLLIADEPTTSLDVTIQEEIVCLLEELRETVGLSIMFISHDLGLVARLCDRIAVMYAGEIVEIGNAEDIVMSPRHPYTRGLMASVPDMNRIGKLQHGIAGTPPMIGAWPSGCRFQPRCRHAVEQCERRQVLEADNARSVRCWQAAAIFQEATLHGQRP